MLKIFNKKYLSELLAKRIEKIKAGDVELFLNIFNEYFHRFRAKYFIIFVLIAIAASATALSAWLIKDVVNVIFVEKQADFIIPLFLVILTIFIVKGGSSYFQIVLSRQISNAMVADIQNRLYDHISKQRVSFFDKQSSDDLLMRFNQGAQGFNSILTTVLVDGSRDAAMVIGLFIVMLIQDAFLTLLCFTVVPVVFYGINILLRKIKAIAKQELEGFADLNKNVRETVQGVTVIKAFNLEKPLKNQTNKIIKRIQKRRDHLAVLQAAPIPLLDTLGGISVGLAILYIGLRTVAGNYDPGTFMSFITALLLAAESSRRLSNIPVKLKTAFIAVSLVSESLNNKQYEESGNQSLDIANKQEKERLLNGDSKAITHNGLNGASNISPNTIINFEGVHFSYSGKEPVLKGFNLEIDQGEMIALVGPSGAGKSTIFKLLLRFYEPNSGTIHINGMPIQDIDMISLRDNLSFVGQSNFIFNGTIKENLALGDNSIPLETVQEACRNVGLHDFIQSQPKGYETNVGELGSLISGGQAQRLNMARAIIKDSPILLLDEVTSALDAENEQLIKNYVQSQVGRKTILVIAHRLSTVKESDRIVLVENGKVADHGNHEELVRRNDYYEKIVALQFSH